MLDIEQPEALVAYLRDVGHVGAEEEPAVRPLEGGISNRTVLVERFSGERWVLKQALPRLRVEAEWYSDPERIHREALGLRWLERLVPSGTITPLLFEDHEHHLLAMEAVPEPHESWKDMLLAGCVERDHVEQFGRLLGEIHRRASELCGQMPEAFEDRSFFESLRLEPYYGYVSEQVPEAASFLHGLIEETRTRQDTLVHGDYSPKNVLVHKGRLTLLDHEVIHLGDPAFDLGFSLTHLLSKAHHLPERREAFAQAAELYWSSYSGAVGEPGRKGELQGRAVRHTLGCLLARVDGRSPLEYLNAEERARQRKAVLTLLPEPPATVAGLVGEFLERL